MSKHYKFAAFGDSYADAISSKKSSRSWWYYLCKNMGSHAVVEHNRAESGTSPFAALTDLYEFIDEGNTASNLIFVFSSARRAPLPFRVPRGTQAANEDQFNYYHSAFLYEMWQNATVPMQKRMQSVEGFNLDNKIVNKLGHTMTDVFLMLKTVFDVATNETTTGNGDPGYYQNRSSLTYFTSKSVVYEVSRICKRKNMQAVFIFPFGMESYFDPDQSPAEPNEVEEFLEISEANLIITHLDTVSRLEMDAYNEDIYGYDWKVDNGGANGDSRCNHLMNENNKILAKLIQEGLEGKRTGIVNFSEMPVVLDDELFEKYATKLYRN